MNNIYRLASDEEFYSGLEKNNGTWPCVVFETVNEPRLETYEESVAKVAEDFIPLGGKEWHNYEFLCCPVVYSKELALKIIEESYDDEELAQKDKQRVETWFEKFPEKWS